MVVDHTFRVAGGARSVVERDRLPLVLGPHFREFRVAGREKGFVIHFAEPVSARSLGIGDVDHDGPVFEPGQSFLDHRRKFGVGDQHLGLAVA